ncbi:putative serine protease K12H4.7 [Dirofilaria immitis]|nr:putative serine protease K12H4.7 [Dirofilaria immitis]
MYGVLESENSTNTYVPIDIIFNESKNASYRPSSPLIGRSSLQQKLDHFDSNNERKWRQYYIHRKSVYQRPDGAVFLVVGGEDGADRAWLRNQDLPYVQLADRINASIFMLEHRFYGSSRPTNDTSVRNLKYLNAKQAVEDIEKFVQNINQREKLSNPKWITFGGSYSGNLAAWARAKHPRSIQAAVASSSPLQAELNFKGKNFVQTFSLKDTLKKLSKKNPKCLAVIRRLFQKMRQMSTTPQGRRELKNHRDLLTLDVMCNKLISSSSLQSIRLLIGMVMTSQGSLHIPPLI